MGFDCFAAKRHSAAEPRPKRADNDGRKKAQEAQKERIGFCDF
jgi:hypothetical protein